VEALQEFFKEFDWTKLAIVALFALPGFISLRVWALISPTSERALKDELGEAIGFGILNAIVCAPLFLLWAPLKPLPLYALVIFTLIVVPAIWPIAIQWCIHQLQALDLILIPSHSAWDDVFLRNEAYFVIGHLNDGSRAGGYYGSNSFAGLHPISGHLYLEQLWYLDESGKFVGPVPDSRGLILRPEDYKYVELLALPKEDTHGG
jgi:Family of unknown function (DUF6338)